MELWPGALCTASWISRTAHSHSCFNHFPICAALEEHPEASNGPEYNSITYFAHVIPLLHELYRFPVYFQVKLKVPVITHKAVHDIGLGDLEIASIHSIRLDRMSMF